MSFLNTVRFLFIIIATLFGYVMCGIVDAEAEPQTQVIWALSALAFACFIVFIEVQIRKAHPKELVVGMIGLVSGLMTATLIIGAFNHRILGISEDWYNTIRAALHIFLGYFGLVVALRYANRLDFSNSKIITFDDDDLANSRILDTSVLIDGRIADIAQVGFLDGTLVIPQFVLSELQGIADSSDPLKRKRGRRGLDVVRRLQASELPIVIDDRDFSKDHAVDGKLVLLAKQVHGKIVTNDYNLNKVAEIQDVKVLNLNDLATAMKQVVLPGEDIDVYIVKEGKEDMQGVGYLDDGTMIVVDGGMSHINEKIEVTVTSVLQTAAGKMIFAKVKDGESVVPHPAAYKKHGDGGRSSRPQRNSQ